MGPEEVRRRVEALPGLPTHPGVASYLRKLVNSPLVSMKQLERAIASDPGLTARLLRFANLPGYGFPGRIGLLSQTLILLGMEMIRGLVLSCPVFTDHRREVEHLRRHSLGVSLVAGAIAGQAGMKELEETTLAGLLHDLGKMVQLVLFPGKYAAVGQLLNKEKIDGLTAEKEILGADHGQLAGWLFAHWSFPKDLWEPVAFHHSPSLTEEAKKEAAAVHLADIIVKGAGLTYSHDPYVPCFDEKAVEILGLSDAQLEAIIGEVADQLKDIDLMDPFSP